MTRLTGVEKRYGSFQALQPLDLEVADGEVFGFLGPNGVCFVMSLPCNHQIVLPRHLLL